MVSITFVIPSVLNKGGGERRLDLNAESLSDAFVQATGILGDDFARRVLEPDGSPRSLINVYINGKNAKFTGGMNASLGAGDEVYILPAVAGGLQELSSAELDRYSRQVMLPHIGYEGQLKLRNAKVCVVGTGGLGNPITARLAAMGVGTLRIVDRDVIETSNLHRQTMFTPDDVGRIKVEVAAERLRKMNPDCDVQPLAVSVNEFSAREVIDGCDVIIDALDSVDARYALNKACVGMNIPFVTGAAVGVSGQAFTVMPKQGACYHCIFPDLDEDEMPTCGIEGVHPSILSIVGGFEVSEAIKVIMGKTPALSDCMLHIDIGDDIAISHTRTFRAEECPVCGTSKPVDVTESDIIVEELCGRNGGKRTFSITPVHDIGIDMGGLEAQAKERNLKIENLGELGISLRNDVIYVNLLQRGSAVVVGVSDQDDAVALYRSLLKYY
ncbi:MAG: 4-methyl-5(B-hydroxyethyl)-thiazole monophosphate biosynthesis protein [Cenarchaeum sp. SB0661_bin_35]|nr:4-methyl-5(B-hydroxyethyl)-thiazole monophosphate biosynthesis protein [Cenarchaeum sp. SB0667_bin_13]MXZ93675.1 4-methyl-5(B-hydroxyethyl)-thiazole monophosphate biosynthesis protein [Cenarchaeum sp. SB0666_bin_15]MYC80398.1 4-methyl-5(B-hydroxyethyl)-thiazole monophosphate biosynthesis protein [Cenarchaeum sp. SB0661_bin_35]MYD59037.1 4-methyl-5(B-hydroxyethyl)-thiazole monophosphate biosynthesis protein [Cenarchaeum sp. SB0678_bin_8]MYI52242.1 4-methyl-5(B-hydroxyethyl)-thiazole monophosp